jgi:hypothetical protein
MIRKHFSFKRLVLGFTVGVAVAAFTAAATQAMVYIDRPQAKVTAAGNYGPLDPWAYAVIHRTAPAATVAGTAIASGVIPPDVRDHQLVRQLVQADRMTSQTSQSGFDWGDAGIGASVSFGIAILLMTAVALGRRYRSRIDRSGLAAS